MKDRKTMGLPSNQLVDFHGEFASKFRILLPINPVHFGQMIHPYRAYLSNFPDKHFSFEELHEVYLNQIAAGIERHTGREQFANELSCLCFWLAYSKERGALDFEETKTLLTAFRFKPMNSVGEFK